MIAPDKNRLQNAKKAKSRRNRRLFICFIGALFVVVGLSALLLRKPAELPQSSGHVKGTALISDLGALGKHFRQGDDAKNNGFADHTKGSDSAVDNSADKEEPGGEGVDPNRVGRLVKPPVRKKLFKHVCDSQIGRVLAIKPGGLVLGKLNYHRNHFVENFKKSLEDPEPVVFSDEDTPEERELKEAVIEARAELKAALERGEDIAEIMQETENELHEMQQYRMEMRKQLIQYQKEEANTVEDLEDFNAAVNQMLSEKGLEPIKSARLRAIKARLNRENDY